MKTISKNIFTIGLIASIFAAPVAHAQEVPAAASSTPVVAPSNPDTAGPGANAVPTDASSTPPVADASSTPPDPQDIQGSPVSVQNPVNTQPAATTTLEDTTNPEEGTSTDPIILDNATSTATSTPIDIVPGPDATPVIDDTQPPRDEPVIEEPVPVVQEQIEDKAPVEIVLAPEPPEPEYTFSLTGKHLTTKRMMKSKDGTTQPQQVTSSLTPQINNADGTISFAGQCSDAYFVVLLYRNPYDYVDDPGSYLINRAYPCVNGSYAYSIADLPKSLSDGTYYLLVGQEGETGLWKPITDLTEININNKN